MQSTGEGDITEGKPRNILRHGNDKFNLGIIPAIASMILDR
jgi:hypothetical protein